MSCGLCPWPRKLYCIQFILNMKDKKTQVWGCNWDGELPVRE